jgi:hypothetical protein
VIILQFDNAYHHWGLLMVQSLALHEAAIPLLCDTANLSREQVTALQGAHPCVAVANSVSSRATTPEQMAARKPFVLQHAMDEYPAEPWYALLDADFLVRRSLSPLWALLASHPAALCLTDGYEHGTYYPQLVTPSGVVIVRKEARCLVDCWAKWYHHDRPLGSIEPREWFWDQVTLTEAWRETGARFAPIGTAYYDDQLLPDAAIWSANVGDRKPRYYELFRAEYERQLSISR